VVTTELGCGIYNSSIVLKAEIVIDNVTSSALTLSETPAVDGIGSDIILLSKSFKEIPIVLAIIPSAM